MSTATIPATFTGWVSTLAKTHTRRLSAVARHEGLTETDALDAVQEAFHTFLLLPQARMLVEDADDARKLMTVLVRNAARNMRRRHFRAKPHDDVDAIRPPSGEEDADVEQLLAKAEEHVQLIGCVTRLGQVQRHVVTLRMLQEASNEETARELGLTDNHVAVLLYRAKRELERCMHA